MNAPERKGVRRKDVHPRWGIGDSRTMPAARDRNMNRVGHLVGQIPEAGCRVQADHAVRHPPAHRDEIQMRRRRDVGDTVDAARELDERAFVPQAIQILPASTALGQLGGGGDPTRTAGHVQDLARTHWMTVYTSSCQVRSFSSATVTVQRGPYFAGTHPRRSPRLFS